MDDDLSLKMSLGYKTRLFLILFLAGMAGVVSILLLDLSAVFSLIPVQAGTELPTITPLLKLLSLIQPSLILALAVFVGLTLAPKVGLSAPVAESAASGSAIGTALRPQLIPGLIGGALGGLAVIVVAALCKPFMTPDTVERIAAFTRLTPIPTRLLYGGITEELLLRWGLMTLLVWATWRVLQKRQSTPGTSCFVTAILLSSLVFGIGHLPIAYMLFPQVSTAVLLLVIVANSAFGLVAGYLYWKKGLESAMIAHMFGHIVMAGASYARLYF
ncbi:MAG TPA: CPBP family intramembrane glutamic endopeptidase, partial [Pyrinomonadaceae bacterium]